MLRKADIYPMSLSLHYM